MQDRVEEPGIVQCPGCHQLMEAKERTPVSRRRSALSWCGCHPIGAASMTNV